MPRRRSKERAPKHDPEEVIRGAVTLDARELCRLIQDVNPTGRRRGAEERALRYRWKAALQDLLIARHGADLLVVPTRRAGIVGLVHRHVREDGGHAVVARLSEASRAWLSSAVTRTTSEKSRPETPRTKGRVASAQSATLPTSPGESARRGRPESA